MNKTDKLTEVYRASNEMEAMVIKGLLESYDVPCLLKSNASHSVHAFVFDGLGEVKVMVLASEADRAKELILKGNNNDG